MLEPLGRLRDALDDPGFQVLVLEPVLYWAPAAGLIVYLAAGACREGKSQKLGLVLILLGCAAAVPLAHVYGLAAPRLKAVTAAETNLLIDAHLARLDRYQFAYLAVTALALLALLFGGAGRAGRWLTLVALAVSLAAVGLGLWLALLSAEVTHPVLSWR